MSDLQDLYDELDGYIQGMKIIDSPGGDLSPEDAKMLRESTQKEIDRLRAEIAKKKGNATP